MVILDFRSIGQIKRPGIFFWGRNWELAFKNAVNDKIFWGCRQQPLDTLQTLRTAIKHDITDMCKIWERGDAKKKIVTLFMTDLERVTNVAIFIQSNVGSISSNCRDINCENNYRRLFKSWNMKKWILENGALANSCVFRNNIFLNRQKLILVEYPPNGCCEFVQSFFVR